MGCRLALVAALVLSWSASTLADESYVEEPLCSTSLDGLHFLEEPPRAHSLSMCRSYSDRTCCTETETNEYLTMVRSAELSEFSAKCVAFTARVLCSACDPDVGTGSVNSICASLCDNWYSACKDEFWETGQRRPFPCMPNALVCSPLSTFASSGQEFCKKMHFDVGYASEDCYDGSSRPKARRRSSYSRSSKRKKSTDANAERGPPPWEGYEYAFGAGIAVAVGILSWRHMQQFLDPENAPRRRKIRVVERRAEASADDDFE